MRVGGERCGGPGKAARKITPHHRSRHIEEQLRQTVRRQLGNIAKDHREGEGGEQRLNDEPQRSEDGLLVARDEVAPHEHTDQVAVMPHIAQLQVIPLLARGNDQIPVRICRISHVYT